MPDDKLKCGRCIILAEQSRHRIVIVNTESGDIIWEWKAETSNIKTDYWKWFDSPSDAKPVYCGRFILLTASGGGVALVRIKDHKTLFYTYVGGNPHSAELLPDGNIVCASSTGNYLTIIKTDTINYPENTLKKNVRIQFGHNVVWDNKRQVLYSAAMDQVITFKYNFRCEEPDLIRLDSIMIPGTEAHDLFPVYNEDALWLTTSTDILKYCIPLKEFQNPGFRIASNIKSVSSGPENLPAIIIRPKERWWTDEVLDTDNNCIFKKEGFRIYKARWFVDNAFSYEKDADIRICN